MAPLRHGVPIQKASALPGRQQPPGRERSGPQAPSAGSRLRGPDTLPDLPHRPRPADRPRRSPDSQGAGRDPGTSRGSWA
ncbi:hypothetical protein NDU88_002833 [Pleurodeles waltl]|uniref:Uncharacterized protein n=1 Tax=Pleurodeles waltl TaxID=8319 RepID=A0AAV7SFH2_PLEWA|nr:hypothetical protein NDU88_002833 [Pleurodeles waltl]